MRAHLEAGGGYEFVPGRVATRVGPGRVDDHTGAVHAGDLVVVCPGAMHDGVAAEFLADAPVRRCRLQMMQTEPCAERLTDRARRRRFAALLPGVRSPVGGRAPAPGTGGRRVPGPAPGRAARLG